MGTCGSFDQKWTKGLTQTALSCKKDKMINGEVQSIQSMYKQQYFRQAIDKIFMRYDWKRDGFLDCHGVRRLLCDMLCREHIDDEDVMAIMKVSKQKNVNKVIKQDFYELYWVWEKCSHQN